MEFWTNLPAWLRYTIALSLVGLGVGIFCFASRVPLGFVGTLVSVGFVLMLICPSDSDKGGYKF